MDWESLRDRKVIFIRPPSDPEIQKVRAEQDKVDNEIHTAKKNIRDLRRDGILDDEDRAEMNYLQQNLKVLQIKEKFITALLDWSQVKKYESENTKLLAQKEQDLKEAEAEWNPYRPSKEPKNDQSREPPKQGGKQKKN